MIRRQKSSRQFGVCGSALERAPVPHKTSRIRRSRSRRLKRPLAPARRSAAVCGGLGSRAKKEPKKAYRDFQAIRRKGVVQGQSRQALMSWPVPVSQVLERQQHWLICSQCLPAAACTWWRRGGRRNADCQLESCGFWLISWGLPVFAETHGHHGYASSSRLVEMCNWCGCSITC